MSVTSPDFLTIRPMQQSDEPFIIKTWLLGLRHGNEWFRLIDHDSYYKHYHDIIENLIRNPATETRIAALTEDPDTILGYACVARDGATIHWTYVKPAWRSHGIGRALLPDTVSRMTHMTRVANLILQSHPTRRIIFDPF